jgi:hypothetical protein
MRPLAYAVGAVAALGLLLAAGPAAAECNRDNALFEDDFEFMDASWGQPNDNVFVEGGAFVVKGSWGQVNFQTTSEVADYCIDATIVESEDPDGTGAFLIFWFQDWENYYSVGYWGNGTFQVDRMIKGKWANVTVVPSAPAIKPGVGQTNSFELKLRPKDVTVFVNGTQISRFKGKPPKGGGPVGFQAFESAGKPAVVNFDNIVVSEPSEPAAE